MDIRLIITADESALELSRNLSGIFVNLVAGGAVKPLGNSYEVREMNKKIKSMENENGELPWELEPKESFPEVKELVKVVATDSAQSSVKTVDTGTGTIVGAAPEEQKAEEKLISLEDLRSAIKSKGLKAKAVKEILSQLNVDKLGNLPEAERPRAMELIRNA